VTWDPDSWVVEENIGRGPTDRLPYTPATMRGAILPSPAGNSHGDRFIFRVSADFGIAALTLALLFAASAVSPAPSTLVAFPQLSSVLVFCALLTLLGYSEGLYRSDIDHETECIVLGKVVAWTTLLAAASRYASGTLTTAVLATGAPLTYFSLLAWRTWRQHQSAATKSSPASRNVLIVGSGSFARNLAAQFGRNRTDRLAVRGFLNDSEPVGGDVLGRPEDLARIARAEFVDEVILTTQSPRSVAQWVIREARRNRLDVKVVADLFELEPQCMVDLEHFGNVPILTIHQEPVPSLGLLAKRAMDIVFSATLLVLTSPLLAAIALLIRLDSQGPVFYRAPRIGRKGHRFLCCKFRTMTADAERRKEQLREHNEREGPFFKIAADPRITRIGHFLRRYSLDELPQLVNVLVGEMSMVGPRPHPLDDCAQYRLQDLRRLDVTPGITGLWQVTARQDPSFERNMALDLEYIERWNLWTDLKILFRTALVVLQGSGA
jgi:exopolysaccharide biosynthesis polyprenyl glycosylphosphotransferase